MLKNLGENCFFSPLRQINAMSDNIEKPINQKCVKTFKFPSFAHIVLRASEKTENFQKFNRLCGTICSNMRIHATASSITRYV